MKLIFQLSLNFINYYLLGPRLVMVLVPILIYLKCLPELPYSVYSIPSHLDKSETTDQINNNIKL
jgi:hypothetical protein